MRIGRDTWQVGFSAPKFVDGNKRTYPFHRVITLNSVWAYGGSLFELVLCSSISDQGHETNRVGAW